MSDPYLDLFSELLWMHRYGRKSLLFVPENGRKTLNGDRRSNNRSLRIFLWVCTPQSMAVFDYSAHSPNSIDWEIFYLCYWIIGECARDIACSRIFCHIVRWWCHKTRPISDVSILSRLFHRPQVEIWRYRYHWAHYSFTFHRQWKCVQIRIQLVQLGRWVIELNFASGIILMQITHIDFVVHFTWSESTIQKQ